MDNYLLLAQSQASIERYLRNYIQSQQIPHAQVFRFGASSPMTVEEFRQILRLSQYRFDQLHLFIIYNFDQTSTIIQNTFLKTLEEHQSTVMFVLVAANLGNILPTIISRCQVKTFKFEPKILSEEQQQQFANTLAQIKQGGLASAVIKLGLKNKKNDAANWLSEFLNYGYQHLHTDSDRLYLGQCLKRAIVNLRLITMNNLDPESGLDQVFLS